MRQTKTGSRDTLKIESIASIISLFVGPGTFNVSSLASGHDSDESRQDGADALSDEYKGANDGDSPHSEQPEREDVDGQQGQILVHDPAAVGLLASLERDLGSRGVSRYTDSFRYVMLVRYALERVAVEIEPFSSVAEPMQDYGPDLMLRLGNRAIIDVAVKFVLTESFSTTSVRKRISEWQSRMPQALQLFVVNKPLAPMAFIPRKPGDPKPVRRHKFAVWRGPEDDDTLRTSIESLLRRTDHA